jgi:hypothetical protein
MLPCMRDRTSQARCYCTIGISFLDSIEYFKNHYRNVYALSKNKHIVHLYNQTRVMCDYVKGPVI